MSAPIFIVGANRSGTTLIRLILNAHPRIGIPEEVSFFNAWTAEHWRNTAPDAETFRHWVQWQFDNALNANAFVGMNPDVLQERIVERASVYDLRSVYEQALQTWADHHGKARWGEKTPGNLFYVDTLCAMFPEAQFLHLVRDPRAGVASMQKTSFFGNDVVLNALNRRKYLREGLVRDTVMPSHQWMRVRYEDLLTDPEATVRSLCTFLNEEYTPRMLRYYESAEKYMKPEAAADFNRSARRPINAAKVTSWRNHLTPHDTAVVEAVCKEEMSKLGYVPDERGISPYARLNIVAKTLYWKLDCYRHKEPAYQIMDRMFERTRQRLARLWKAIFRTSRSPSTWGSDSSPPTS